MVIVTESLHVIDKFINSNEKPDGTKVDYFNLRVGGMGYGINISVPEAVFKLVDVDSDVRLSGKCGLKNGQRYWFFDDLYTGD